MARGPIRPRMSRRKEAYTPARIEASPLEANDVGIGLTGDLPEVISFLRRYN